MIPAKRDDSGPCVILSNKNLEVRPDQTRQCFHTQQAFIQMGSSTIQQERRNTAVTETPEGKLCLNILTRSPLKYNDASRLNRKSECR